MSTLQLRDIDPQDIEDVIAKIEISFGFTFEKTDLKKVSTYGELCDAIIQKIHLANIDDCTTQQAFYKLREAIVTTLNSQKSSIKPSTRLSDFFPRKRRKSAIKKIEKELGFKLKILGPPSWVILSGCLTFILSLGVLYFDWEIGLLGLAVSIAIFSLAYNLGKEFYLNTLGEVANKMSRENYLKSRRDPSTINRNEIEMKIRDLFESELGLDRGVLIRDAKFS